MQSKYAIYATLAVFAVAFLSGCAQGQTQQPVCKEIQVPYSENPCQNKITLSEQYDFADNPVLSNERYECTNKPGLGTGNYGNIRGTWEFANKNDILLSTPCEIVIEMWDSSNPNDRYLLQKKTVDSFTVNIPAQSTKTITKTIYLPKCWGGFKLACDDIDEIPECQSVTKYRTETKCE